MSTSAHERRCYFANNSARNIANSLFQKWIGKGFFPELTFRDGKGGRLYVYKQRTDFLQGQTGAGGLHPQRLEAVCETYAGLPEDQGMERLTGTGKESTSPTLH